MASPLGQTERAQVARKKKESAGSTTIDNGATHTQMRFLAKVHAATGEQSYAGAFRRGLAYLLDAQYPNGGWPQFFPLRDGYWSHITYNDDAMVGVLEILRGIANREPDYRFASPEERDRARTAYEKGIDCILRTQVTVNGRLTAWCAQHDQKTLAPAQARSYEHPFLSGFETVGLVRFLMSIEKPSPAVIRSVESAVRWLSAVKLTGIRLKTTARDRVIVADPAAPPLWARFYEIGTNRPIFSGRDGVIRYRLSEIEQERRNGYRWYVNTPAVQLEEEYPKWMKKWAGGEDVR
jgi:PelA/Pel-15E family pectate lyase